MLSHISCPIRSRRALRSDKGKESLGEFAFSGTLFGVGELFVSDFTIFGNYF
jgi:hypothetical protein